MPTTASEVLPMLAGFIRSTVSSPLAQALFVTVLWSTSWVLIKIGLADDIPPLTFAGLRYTLAAVVLLGVLMGSPARRAELAATSGRMRGLLAVFGLVMFGLTQGAQFVGLSLLPAATLSLLLSFTTILVAVVSIRHGMDGRAAARQWAGMGIALIGAAIYLAPDLGVVSMAGMLVGLCALGSNTAAAMLGRHVNGARTLSPLAVTAPAMAVGGVATLGVGLLVEGLPALSPSAWVIVAWLALVNTAFAFTLWNHTLRSLTATESSAINNTMLVQIALLAWLFLDEALTVSQWAALAVVSLGTWLVRRRDRDPHGAAPPRPGPSPSRGT